MTDGFTMGFSIRVLPVALDVSSIPPLLERARALIERDRAPSGRPGCQDCGRLDGILALFGPAAAA